MANASLLRPCETQLQRPGRWGRRTPDDIATSISPSGWLAAASAKHIRLYNVKEANRNTTIPLSTSVSINTGPDDRIRAIALSEDLLVVLTRSKLFVYGEYRTRPDLVKSRDVDQAWSVSIEQAGVAAPCVEASASVVVGGVGVAGVMVFRYVYKAGWNAQHDYMRLLCPGNIGAIKTVGFSPYQSNALYGPLAFALTKTNRLYCWLVGNSSEPGIRNVQPSWHIDCNSLRNQHVS